MKLPGALATLGLLAGAFVFISARASSPSPIQFVYQPIPFQLESNETPARNAPETMAGGVAIFDYNRDGRPDIFFTNGGNIATLKKDSPKYRNRLFRNDGNGVFTDVTEAAGLAGTGYDIGAVVGDYDNDGYPDLFRRRRLPQHALPQQWRRHVHGRHRQGRPGPGQRSGLRPAVGHFRGLGGRQQRRVAGPVCFELPPVALQRPAHVQLPGDPRLLPSTILQGPAQFPVPQPGRRTFKDVSANGESGSTSARAWAWASRITTRTAVRTSS